MEIFNKVKNILSELTTSSSIETNDELQNDLGLDSIRLVTLLVMIEETFDIILDESDMNPFDLIKVNDVINLVEKYTGGNNNENI